jgi:hypothetical protein
MKTDGHKKKKTFFSHLTLMVFLALVSLPSSLKADSNCSKEKPCLREKIIATMGGPKIPPFQMSWASKNTKKNITVSDVKKAIDGYMRQYHQLEPKELAESNGKVKAYFLFSSAFIHISDDPPSMINCLYNVEYRWKPFKELDAAEKNSFFLEAQVSKNKNKFEIEIKYPDLYDRYSYGNEGKAGPRVDVDPFNYVQKIFDSQKMAQYLDDQLGV